MRRRPLYDEEARLDLKDIRRWVAKDNPAAAMRLLVRLRAKCERLAKQPGIGAPRDDLQRGLRSFPVGNYVIFYRPTEAGVFIVRVLHGHQDAEAQLRR